MNEAHTLDRREFSVKAALAILSGVLITITGCDDDDNPSQPSPLMEGDVAGVIANNHGHVAVVTRVQITAGAAIVLDIRGTADHTHTVSLTAAELAQIGGGQRVAKESTTQDNHNHMVTFN